MWDLNTALVLKNYTFPHLCPTHFSEDPAFFFFFESKLFLLDNFNQYKSFFLLLIKSVLERQLSSLPFVLTGKSGYIFII